MNRFTPLFFKNKHFTTNRIVVPPMASSTADHNGLATDKTLEHYKRLAHSGAGIVFVEYTYIHTSGKSEAQQIGLTNEAQAKALIPIASIIKKSGALAILQLTHSGGKSDRELTNGDLMGPSGIAVPSVDHSFFAPRPMELLDIIAWKQSFLTAAHYANEIGFDGVEIHSAHGYGLNQFLSPITNLRQDDYGGNLFNRLRLLMEIVSEIKKEMPEFLVSIRYPGQDFIEGGLTVKESIVGAKILQKLGTDMLNVSSGIGGWRRPRNKVGEGYLADEAASIQCEVEIPVIAVGGIESYQFIEKGLAAKEFSLAAVGRAILNDPEKWKQSNLSSM